MLPTLNTLQEKGMVAASYLEKSRYRCVQIGYNLTVNWHQIAMFLQSMNLIKCWIVHIVFPCGV
jgi:hypothetical protein